MNFPRLRVAINGRHASGSPDLGDARHLLGVAWHGGRAETAWAGTLTTNGIAAGFVNFPGYDSWPRR